MTALPPPTTTDPVLAGLQETAARYAAVVAQWEQTEEAARRALDERDAAVAEADRLRRRAARQKERADRLARALADLHRAAFSGNLFELILRACMGITGATRGVYLTALDGNEVRPRAAAELDGYPHRPASAFLKALCGKVLADGKSFVANEPHEFARFPAPDGPAERFSDCLVTPSVLLDKLNGVVVLADKPGGFDDDDVDAVLSVGDQAGVVAENRCLQDELARTYYGVVGALADVIDAKDPYTHGHCEQVARLARQTAERLAVTPRERGLCAYGGLLHDVGKVAVSDGVLNKPGTLLPEEWTLMRSHVRVGRDLLARLPALDGVGEVVLYHHERWDGTGYPDGLAGDRIPLPARVVAVADAYAAMTSKRSYRDSLTPAEARAELVRCKGTHFDPAVVDAFLAVLDADATAQPDWAPLADPAEAADLRHVIRPEAAA
jgi:HD-GYP domain-containing protein (c-di-GMP phosphodiesterase class II)